MKLAKVILFASNVLLSILAIAVGVVAGLVLQFGADLSQVIDTYMLWMALVTGVGVLFIACIACVAALNFHRTWAKLLLVCYGFLLFILLALECGAIALVWMRRSEFSDCQTNAYGSDACPDDQHALRIFHDQTNATCCPNREDPTCAWVKDILTDANCNDPDKFRSALWAHISGMLTPVGIFAIVLCVFEFLTMCAACCLAADKDKGVAPSGVVGNSFLDRLDHVGSDGGLPLKSRAVLLIVNFVLLVLGVGMAAFAAYTMGASTDMSAVVGSEGPLLGLITGASIALLALMGCVGACNWEKGWAKCVLVVYDIALIVIILVEIATAVLLIVALTQVSNCRKSPLGSSECEDAAGSVRDWVNTTRNTCCAHRTDAACAWAKSALNDNTCASFTSFKRALLKEVQERLVPVVIIIIILIIIQLVTCCSTCILIKAKGKALLSGKAHHFYKQPANTFYYGHDYSHTQRGQPVADNQWSQQPSVRAPAANQQATAPSVPTGDLSLWKEVIDRDSGKPYYYNKQTRQTSWQPPAGWYQQQQQQQMA